jgi:hypothetical protein
MMRRQRLHTRRRRRFWYRRRRAAVVFAAKEEEEGRGMCQPEKLLDVYADPKKREKLTIPLASISAVEEREKKRMNSFAGNAARLIFVCARRI